ncbi:MAG: cation:proton antiporter [Verrucomicrobia bacterium]|nr:cation:proton antiporter [Verrucomicrobiota bacterium]
MESNISFITDFALVMLVASIAMLVFHRFRQPVILGYIATGFLLGPHTPSILGLGLKHKENLESMSEIAIVLLLFSLGLEFNVRRIRQVGMSSTIAAISEIVMMFATGCIVGRLFGWKFMDCLFMGAILATSSTMVISKTLADLKMLKERFSGIIIGITVVEDIVCISLMAILASIAMTGSFAMSELTGTLGRLGLFFVLALIFGLLLVPRLMNYVERSGKTELILIVSLGLCFGMALLAERLGYSTALGAFIMGALIAETHIIHKVERAIQPIKDMFSGIFFVVIGTMIDPHALLEYWVEIVVLFFTVIIFKTLACTLGALTTGNSFPTSLKVGLGMSNVGEVSFIILALGLSLGVLDAWLYPIGVTVAISTMMVTPFIFNRSEGILRVVNRLIPRSIMQTIGVYSGWYQQRGPSQRDISTELARKFLIKNMVNLTIVTAVLIIAAVSNHGITNYLSNYSIAQPLFQNIAWLLAFVFCVPFLLITQQNHAALAHLISRERLPENLKHLQIRIERVIKLFGFFVLSAYLAMLILIIMPASQWGVIYILAFIAGVIGFFLRNQFARVYQKAEIEIETILTRESSPSAKKEISESNRSVLLNDTRMITVLENGLGVGKTIRDIDIRNKSGATVISIERNKSMIVSPRGEEILEEGDHLLVLGNTEQLGKAELLINGEEANS